MNFNPASALIGFLLIVLQPSYGNSSPVPYGEMDEAVISSEKIILSNGRIYRAGNNLSEIATDGGILGISGSGGTVSYIRESGQTWFAGAYRIADEDGRESPLGSGFRKLYKLTGTGNAFYFLADMDREKDGGSVYSERVFVRFDAETSEKRILSGVSDFAIIDNSVILLERTGLNCNGVIIPLMIAGDTWIDKIVDGRIFFITDGNETEVCDILSERNIYQYRAGAAFPVPGEYNIILEFSDAPRDGNSAASAEAMAYYQVSLNGYDSGRTEAGPAKLGKDLKLEAEPGRYCIIKAERWELDLGRGRYVRVNNVYQPGEIKLFLPENRIIKIKLEFNGEKYSISQSVYTD